MTVTIAEVPWASADGARLRWAMQVELAARYNMPDQEVEPPTAETISVFLIARHPGGDAVGCGALRLLEDGTAEIKRMYVTPETRGTGVATRILRALENYARLHGVESLVLSTGVKQPDAIRFYEREGYQPIDGYGPYVGEPLARCFTLRLS
jgi:GNAT superfamily N-acetyltransferase